MSENILVCSVNWLGDCIMSMPAIQAYRAQHPDSKLSLLTKTKLAPLWQYQVAVDEVLTYEDTNRGTFVAARRLRQEGFDCAFIFPNSFRSALIPFWGGIPRRIGAAAHGRRLMLSEISSGKGRSAGGHQQWEYFRILGIDPAGAQPPQLALPSRDAEATAVDLQIEPGRALVALIPGAARGTSKRWPEGRFIETGQALVAQAEAQILLFGTADESDLCERIAGAVGNGAVNLGGRTSLPELIALLSLCRVAIANDSGGMHLAAATGTPVVAIFGATDPARTGPIGPGHKVICAEGAARSRYIPRESAEAEDALASIDAAAVIEAAVELLNVSTGGG